VRPRPRVHRSKPLAFFGALAVAFAGCSKGADVAVRSVVLHVPAACPASSDAYATYFELGDFEPAAPQEGHYLYAVGAALPELDAQTRALVVQATQAAEAGGTEAVWEGVAGVPASGDVDVLILPRLASCPLTTNVGQRTGSTLGAIAPGRVMLVGGTSAPTPDTYIANLDTGAVEQASPGLLSPRSHATVTPFGPGALVAGGLDPSALVLDSAEVYDAGLGGFDQQNALHMSAARADHGAVVLATGETLLVGGIGADGKTVLGTMEILDPASRVVRAEGVAQLSVPRRDPSVLLLASGEVLVAGGFDATGAPVSTLEWFTPDVSRHSKATQDLGAVGPAQAYAALEGGGALAVAGSPSGAACSFTVWQVSADGQPQRAPSVACSAAPQPVFFGGASGAPVLWTGQEWLRWQPWRGTFGALNVLGETPTIADATCAADPGMAMWLHLEPSGSDGSLTALRFDTSNVYSPLAETLVTDASSLAPDRLPLAGVVSFDTQSPEGALDLGPGASAFVTDRTYDDVAVDVTLPASTAPFVVLRDAMGNETEVGDLQCPADLAGPSQVHVERHGATVSWSTGAGSSGACTAGFDPSARVAVGLRGPPGTATSKARALRVTRLAPGAP
jgi:hypothetical protein